MNRRKRAAAAVIAIILVAAMVVPLVVGAWPEIEKRKKGAGLGRQAAAKYAGT